MSFFSARNQKGFTLVELLVVIGIIAILAAIVLVAVNPGRQFAQARDTQRRADLYNITNAIYQYAAEHNGNLPGTFPTSPKCIGTAGGCFNLGAAGSPETMVPTYVAAMPMDPAVGTAADTKYYVNEDANGRVVATAAGELAGTLTVIR